MANYYDILGVPKGADEKTIRQSYRKLARQFHPDLNPSDKGAADKFKEINEAYEVLSDPESREKYDKYGDQWKDADQFEARSGARSPYDRSESGSFQGRTGGFEFDLFGGLDDLLGGFGSSAGRPATALRMETDVVISLEEAYHGTHRTVTLTGPEGQRRIEVSIPPGVDTGSTVRVNPAEGQELHINTTVQPHSRFRRRSTDLYTDVRISLFDALLGGETNVETITGKVSLTIPAGSQNGQRIRLSGRGMPSLKRPEEKGDMFVTLRPQLPKDLTDEERELIEKFRALREPQTG